MTKLGARLLLLRTYPSGDFPRLQPLDALMLELSLQLLDACISCLSFRPSLNLSFVDASNESLCDVHNGFGVLLVELEDGGGGSGREQWCRGGQPEGGRGVGVGLIGGSNRVVRHLGSLRVMVRARELSIEVGVFASVRGFKRRVLAKEEEDAQRLLGVELVCEPLDTVSGRCDKVADERTSGLSGDESHNLCSLEFIVFIAFNGTA
jgi:hypothetical protein